MVDLVTLNGALGVASRVREHGLWLAGLVRRLLRQPKDQAPGDWAARTAAYRHFGETAIGVSQDLQLLATLGTPPRLLGALWSWPAVVRASRRLNDRFAATLAALLEIALVGDQAVLAAAGAAGEALGELAAVFPDRRGGGLLPPDFEGQIEVVAEKLADFVTAARTDLQKKE